MKVVHFISQGDVGGAKTYVLALLEALRGQADTKLVCLARSRFAQEAAARGFDTLVCPTPFRHFGQMLRLARDCDILHCHGAKANVLGACLKPFVRAAVVSTVHSDYRLDYLGRPLRQLLLGNANRLALRAADWRMPVSRDLGDLLIRGRYAPQRITCVHSSMDFDQIPPAGDRRAFFNGYRFPVAEDDVVIGFAGRLVPVKDVPTLLRAFALARQDCKNLKLFLAGDGDEMSRLKNLAASLKLREAVCFAGWVDDIPRMAAAVDIFAMSSKSEGFPYALLEAAMYRVPVAATSVGGIPDFIEHGRTGFLFEPGDAQALAAHFVALARDPGLRRRLGEAGYECARARYSLQAMARDQMEAYRRVLALRQRPRRDGVVICGAYGKGNAGDEAILRAIIGEMRQIDPEMPVRVMTRSPLSTRLLYRVDAHYTFHFPALLHALRRSALYINGGGSLMQDITSSRSLYYYLFTLAAGRRAGCRVMMYGCGIGPLNHKLNRRLVRRVLDACVDVITLREDASLTELRAVGVTKPRLRLAADPALTLAPAGEHEVRALFEAAGIPWEGRYLCLSMRPWEGFASIAPAVAACADYAWERYGLATVFLPIEIPRDLPACTQVAARLRLAPHYTLLCREAPLSIAAMARMEAALAMRLHALVFAASRGVPMAGIAYDQKVGGFLRYLGQMLVTDIPGADEDTLRGFVDQMMAEDREALRRNARRLLSLEEANLRCARALLAGPEGKDRI